MKFADSTSWVAGYSGSSSTVCTPSGMTVIDTGGAGPAVKSNDTNAGVASWSSTNCTGGTGNWISYVVEILADTCSNTVHGTWTCVQHTFKPTCASPCTIAFASTGTGHAGIITASLFGSAVTISSISTEAGTWTDPGCSINDATAGELDSWYNTSLTNGITGVTVTMSGAGSPDITFEELANSGTISYDTCATRDQSTGATSIAGATLTLTGTDDWVVQAANFQGSFTQQNIDSTYREFVGSNGNPDAWKATASGTAPTWTTTSGRATLIGIALQAVASGGGGTACVGYKAMMGVGCK